MKNQEFPPKNNNNLMKPPVPYKPESVIRHARLSANSSIYSKNKHNNNKNLIQKRITQFEQTATTQTDSQQGAFSSSGSSLSESSIALSHTNKNKSRGALDDSLEFKNKTHETASPSTSSPPPSEDADANNSCFQNQGLEVVLQSGGDTEEAMKKSSEMHSSMNSDTEDTSSDYIPNKKSTSKSDIEENNTAIAATTGSMETEHITNTNTEEEENKSVSNQKISKKLRSLSGTFEKVRDVFSDLTIGKNKKPPPPKPPRQDMKIEIISSVPMYNNMDVPDSSSSTRTSKDSNYCSSFLSTSPALSNSDPDSKRSTRDSTFYVESNKSTIDSTAAVVGIRSEDTGTVEEKPITNTNIEPNKNVSDQGITQVNLKEESQNVDKEPETTPVAQMTRGKKIYLAAKELRDTEETFLNVLTMLDVDFREFITEKNPNDIIIPQASFEEIFSNMNMLRNLSEANLKEFRECIKNWQEPDKTKIAHVLVKQGYFLQMFGQYTNDYTKNHQLFLELLEKFPKFKEAVLEFQSRDCCQNLPITGFFLKPCQRLAQYKLLMENYKKKLFPVSIDYQDACKALDIVTKATEHVNAQMKREDNFKCILELQQRMNVSDLIKPDRILLHHATVCKRARKEEKERYLILFNDIMIVAKQSLATLDSRVSGFPDLQSQKYNVGSLEESGRLKLNEVDVTEGRHKDEYPLDFEIQGKSRSFTFVAKDAKSKSVWMEKLTSAIEECKKRKQTFHDAGVEEKPKVDFKQLGHVAPVWIPDSRVTMCHGCYTTFTYFFRRHHCRACGGVYCSTCSSNKTYLEYSQKKERVCNECFGKMNPDNEENVGTSADTVSRKKINKILLINVDDPKITIKGQLYKYSSNTKSWRKVWMVLKEFALFEMGALEDKYAKKSWPIMGYQIEHYERLGESIMSLPQPLAGQAFRLTHPNMEFLLFYAETTDLANNWLEKLEGACDPTKLENFLPSTPESDDSTVSDL